MEDNDKLDLLQNECKLVQENCTYQATIHFLLAERKLYQARLFTLVPAVLAAVSGSLVALGAPIWLGWLVLVAGVTSAIASILDPEHTSQEHLKAATDFTSLKHDARALHEVYHQFVSIDDFFRTVQRMGETYNQIVSNAPLITNAPFASNKKIFLQAQEWIKAGKYESDIEQEINTNTNTDFVETTTKE